MLFLLFALASNVQAEIILGHITGTVTDSVTGQPIEGATVTASTGSEVNGTATTNATGYYDIGGLNGNFDGIIYTVTAQKTGYYPSTVSVTMVSSIDFVKSVQQNFILTSLTNPTPTPTIPEFSTPIFALLGGLASALLFALVRSKKRKT